MSQRSYVAEAKDLIVGALVGARMGAETLNITLEAIEQERVDLQMTKEGRETLAREGLGDLELAFDDIGWRDMNVYEGFRMSRQALRRAISLSRLMYLLNPLIKRAVTVQELYVWGSGFTINANEKVVDGVLKDFFEDQANEKVIGTGDEGWPQRERDQRIDGNSFFCFFVNRRTGAVRVRTLSIDYIDDVICNPEDIKEPWFYRKISGMVSTAPDGDLNAPPMQDTKQVLYPDIFYDPVMKQSTWNGVPIDWNTRILHVRTGGVSTLKFGMPELLAGLNWATAYKRILENFATILAAYARFAMKITGNQGKKGVAATRSKMNTALNSSTAVDTNPPNNTAAYFAASGGMDVAPVKTANSTTAPDEARALRSMVAAAADIPEHFFGDSEVGNMATSATLDRPTELKMISRQQMWRNVISTMAKFVIAQSALAIDGKLRNAGYKGTKTLDPFSGRTLRVTVTPPADKTVDFEVEFPNITERAITERVRALVNAATLNGRKAEGLFPNRKYLFKLMLQAMGVRNAERVADEAYPSEVKQGFVDPKVEAENKRMEAEAKKTQADASMIQAKSSKVQAEKPAPTPVKASKRVRTIERDPVTKLMLRIVSSDAEETVTEGAGRVDKRIS